ncbi:MAG: IS3 family transposase [Ardenticatenaceae bacterium]|nr:IS3 family transposase [Ardenticatenaceae bacterium]
MRTGSGQTSVEPRSPPRTQRRELVLRLGDSYPITRVCDVLGVARSSYSDQAQAISDEDLAKAIRAVVVAWPTYDYRRVPAQLRREGAHAHRTRVRRRMHALGLVGQPPVRHLQTPTSHHEFGRAPHLVEGLPITAPAAVWVGDITAVQLADSFGSLAVRMDGFTRLIRGGELRRSRDHRLTLTALERARATGAPKLHHSDQGVQDAASPSGEGRHRQGVAISLAAIGQPEEHGLAERLMRTRNAEAVNLSDDTSFQDADCQIRCFLDDVYAHTRIHSALGSLTPAEFQQQCAPSQLAGSSPLIVPFCCPVLGAQYSHRDPVVVQPRAERCAPSGRELGETCVVVVLDVAHPVAPFG